jgi:hypothetical protein
MPNLTSLIEGIIPQSHDVESGMEEIIEEEYLEEAKGSIEIYGEELEKQIINHISNHRSYDREG